MSRSQLREHIFRMLFCNEFNGPQDMKEQETLYFELNGNAQEQDREYVLAKYQAVMKKKDEIDGILNRYAKNWNTKRMNRVDLSILRLAAYEILFDESIPTGVAINEAVELAKRYSSDEGPAFINGILAKVAE